jgi:hypothetical protein
MNLRKVIQRQIRRRAPGVDVAGDVNAVVSANVGERESSTSTSSTQKVVHRSRQTARSQGATGRSADERSD